MVVTQAGSWSEVSLSVEEHHHGLRLACAAFNPLLPTVLVEDSHLLHVLCT
jgi:hypothetical protein